VLLFYVDESGTASAEGSTVAGTDSRHLDYFVLAAVGIHDSSRAPLARAVIDIKAKYLGVPKAKDDWRSRELKARYLMAVARKGQHFSAAQVPAPYVALVDVGARKRLAYDLRRLFTRFRPATVAVVVDKTALKPTGLHPLEVGYAKLYEQVALVSEHVYGGETAILVPDLQLEHEKQFESGDVLKVREMLKSKGTYAPDFNLVMDKPLWIADKQSILDREIIQLADIAAYATYEWYRDKQPPTEPCLLWDAIAPSFVTHMNKTVPLGAGLRVYPDPGKYPAIS
jgi:hypothetical protein